MVCPDVLEADNPLKSFSSALLNFHNHYACIAIHLYGVNTILRYVMYNQDLQLILSVVTTILLGK